jgi:type I restriction enzyme S subunit
VNPTSYPRYKPSGFDLLGVIPTHWDLSLFKWQIERNDGGVWGGDPDGEEDTIVLRSTEQTVDGRWRIEDPARRRLSISEKDSSRLLDGDLLITKSSGSSLHIGKTTIVTNDIASIGCSYSNFMQRIRVKNVFMPKLAWYVMNSDITRTQLRLLSNSTTGLANLNGTMIGQILMAVPPVDEQASIAAFLDRETARIDALIEEQKRLIELLKEKRQAVISHAVTKGLDPTAPMKDSGVEWLGEVPAHWEVKPLKHLINLQSGGTPSKDRLDYWDGSIPWVSAKDLKSDNLVDSQDHISEAAIAGSAASLTPAGSVLVLVRGMMLARTFPVCRAVVPMAINQDLKAIEGKAGVSNHFLAWLLRGTAQETLNRLDEAGHGTKALRMDAWLSMLVPLPPENEQVAIALTVDKRTEQIDALMEETASAKALLQERRSALISAAVTGKIDVREFAPAELEPPR